MRKKFHKHTREGGNGLYGNNTLQRKLWQIEFSYSFLTDKLDWLAIHASVAFCCVQIWLYTPQLSICQLKHINKQKGSSLILWFSCPHVKSFFKICLYPMKTTSNQRCKRQPKLLTGGQTYVATSLMLPDHFLLQKYH